jgi:hypothetical protein
MPAFATTLVPAVDAGSALAAELPPTSEMPSAMMATATACTTLVIVDELDMRCSCRSGEGGYGFDTLCVLTRSNRLRKSLRMDSVCAEIAACEVPPNPV